jgi:hypothetical protein
MEIRPMKRIAAAGLFLAALSGVTAAQPPQAEIHNKELRLTIYLPDSQNGFYRDTRFDWSGVIGNLDFSGHHLYRPWFSSVDPSVHDFIYKDSGIVAGVNTAMTGPAEEFQEPIGYANAKPGDNFLKIGVGLLRKADDTPYFFGKHFDIVDGGLWTVRKTSHSITFEQVLGGAGSDYGYVYTKTIRLVGNGSQFVIDHHLKNTGKLPLATRLYDHNFLTVDGLGVGTADSVTVPYDIQPTQPPNSKFVHIDGKTASYVADLQGQDRVAFGLQGFSGDAKDYNFIVVNRAAPVQVEIAGDRPLVDASVWSIRSILAVEPFIDIHADPGKDMSWSYTYTYSIPGAAH